MNEWIIAPLLAPDPTGIVSHRPSGNEEAGGAPQEEAGDRRHGDRRDNHDEEADPDFARGEDRREDAM
ncbi:hypothetical protein [Massilia sp. Leaf139]|uniref:hypothetical protein n=1 Tax=Massilia sp. Leaf139 TaxID=1736272 RepID=UPI0006F7F992|nr:hypothetical protein [Massilia sp. Leaf139]KQQ91666.1 hypothetical protein ASF77_06965 [Massilia sp. Leaf139]